MWTDALLRCYLKQPRKLSRKSAVFVGSALGLSIGVLTVLVRTLEAASFFRFWVALDELCWVLAGSIALILVTAAVLRSRHLSTIQKHRFALGLCLSLLCLMFTLRLEGFSGRMFPNLVWRWSRSPTERFARFHRAQTDLRNLGETVIPVDLTRTSDTDYPGFLGAHRSAVSGTVKIERNWSENPPRELWSHPVGLGWSSFSVVSEFAITQEQRGNLECVVCYELKTGRELWIHSDEARFDHLGAHGVGPRSTPTIHGGMVFTMGATGVLNCLAGGTGKVRWQHELFESPETQNLTWGMSGSPLIVDSTVVVATGVGLGRSVVAFDIETGDERWAEGDAQTAYASLQLATLNGVRQILWFNGLGLCGLIPENGHVMWNFPWKTQGHQMVNVAQPLVLADFGYRPSDPLVLISSGYDQGCALLRVSGMNDVWLPQCVWQNKLLKSKFSNMIVEDGFVYGMDNGIMVCLDLSDGRQCWKRGRYGHGQLMKVGNLILLQAESGEIILIDPNPNELREMSRLPGLGEKTWNHLALSGKILLSRSDRNAVCFELK